MILITARTNSSFVTTSSIAIAVAVFLSLSLFFQLVSQNTNCQLTGPNPQVTWYALTENMVQHEKSYEVLGCLWSFQKSSSTVRISCSLWPCSGVKSTFLLCIVNKILTLIFTRATQTFQSKCLCHKIGIGGFFPCECKSSALGFVLWPT